MESESFDLIGVNEYTISPVGYHNRRPRLQRGRHGEVGSTKKSVTFTAFCVMDCISETGCAQVITGCRMRLQTAPQSS